MKNKQSRAAFSLIEVVAAVGLAGFVLISLIALLSFSTSRSRDLIVDHNTESAMAALYKHFCFSSNGFALASALPADTGQSPEYYVIYSDRTKGAWTVTNNAPAEAGYRVIVALTKSLTAAPANSNRLLVRFRLYNRPTIPPSTGEMPYYEGDLVVRP